MFNHKSFVWILAACLALCSGVALASTHPSLPGAVNVFFLKPQGKSDANNNQIQDIQGYLAMGIESRLNDEDIGYFVQQQQLMDRGVTLPQGLKDGNSFGLRQSYVKEVEYGSWLIENQTNFTAIWDRGVRYFIFVELIEQGFGTWHVYTRSVELRFADIERENSNQSIRKLDTESYKILRDSVTPHLGEIKTFKIADVGADPETLREKLDQIIDGTMSQFSRFAPELFPKDRIYSACFTLDFNIFIEYLGAKNADEKIFTENKKNNEIKLTVELISALRRHMGVPGKSYKISGIDGNEFEGICSDENKIEKIEKKALEFGADYYIVTQLAKLDPGADTSHIYLSVTQPKFERQSHQDYQPIKQNPALESLPDSMARFIFCQWAYIERALEQKIGVPDTILSQCIEGITK